MTHIDKDVDVKADAQGSCVAETSEMIGAAEDMGIGSELSKTEKRKVGFMERWGGRFLRQRKTRSLDTYPIPAQNIAAAEMLHEKEKSEMDVSEELLSKRPSSRGIFRRGQSTPGTPSKNDSTLRSERHSWTAIEKKCLHVLECIGHVTDKEKSSCGSHTSQTQLFFAEKSS